jgi:hypothetical protein
VDSPRVEGGTTVSVFVRALRRRASATRKTKRKKKSSRVSPEQVRYSWPPRLSYHAPVPGAGQVDVGKALRSTPPFLCPLESWLRRASCPGQSQLKAVVALWKRHSGMGIFRTPSAGCRKLIPWCRSCLMVGGVLCDGPITRSSEPLSQEHASFPSGRIMGSSLTTPELIERFRSRGAPWDRRRTPYQPKPKRHRRLSRLLTVGRPTAREREMAQTRNGDTSLSARRMRLCDITCQLFLPDKSNLTGHPETNCLLGDTGLSTSSFCSSEKRPARDASDVWRTDLSSTG